MGASVRRVMAVATLTFREALRRKIVIAAAVMSLGFLALYGLGLHFAAADLLKQSSNGLDELMMRAAAAQMLYIGLLPASFIIGLTAVLASVGTISSELESGVIYGVVARPIRRAELVLGKFLGLGSMLAVYALLLNGAIVALARWQIHSPLTDWPSALALLAFEPLIISGLALLGSTRLPTLANGVLCAAVYATGFVGGFIEQIGGLMRNHTMMNLGVVSSLLMPLDAIHRKAVALLIPGGLLLGGGAPGAGGFGESTTPSVWMVVYAVAYVLVCVWGATRIFGKRDL